ncbi:MAG TPA: SDR family oxidoreductase [Streptosporangiaceae bacterium]|nr:SDR family oxidoreductase [Streptosporangiaceae bacterium]
MSRTSEGRFEGRVAIVTGAAQGIGEAYARALAAEGAHVLIADLNAEAGPVVAADLERAVFVRTDVSDPASAAAMAERAVTEFGGIDYLVNNAAIYGDMQFDLLLKVDWDYYKRFMGVNLDGACLFLLSDEARWLTGQIINVDGGQVFRS